MQEEPFSDDLPVFTGTRDDPEPLLPAPDGAQRSAPAADTITDLGPESASDIDPHPEPSAGLGADQAPAERPPEARIVALLYERGKLTAGDLARARRLADDGGEPLLRMLVRLGLISERDMAQAMSEVLDLPLADPAQFPAEPVAEGLFTLRFLKDARVLPMEEDEEHLRVAVADAVDPYILPAVAMAAGRM